MDDYLAWLRGGMTTQSVGDICEITTPFLDRHNDHLQIYVDRRGDDEIVLSDDGYILSDLRSAGVDITTDKRKAVIETILNGFGVRKDAKQLKVSATRETFGQKLHTFAQAMLALGDMYVLAQPRVATYFLEDVRHFLNEKGVRYSPNVKLTGVSGFDHAINFLIPGSRTQPERLVQTINQPNKNTIGSYLFALNDTQQARGEHAVAYAFLKDKGRGIPRDIRDALEHYRVTAVPWSERESFAEALAA